VAATNAVRGAKLKAGNPVNPIGSFTDPEYAHVGLTEKKARESHNAVTAVARFASATRTIIDGRTTGFCKLIPIGCAISPTFMLSGHHRKTSELIRIVFGGYCGSSF
jgi:pyridine nucleotide-disulfide oxidoreductase